MARRIEIDIDLAKIDKSKINVKGNGKYYKMTAIETTNGKYGDWMVVEKQTKEERDAKNNGKILGNGKNFGWGDSGPKQKDNTHVSSDDLPY